MKQRELIKIGIARTAPYVLNPIIIYKKSRRQIFGFFVNRIWVEGTLEELLDCAQRLGLKIEATNRLGKSILNQ